MAREEGAAQTPDSRLQQLQEENYSLRMQVSKLQVALRHATHGKHSGSTRPASQQAGAASTPPPAAAATTSAAARPASPIDQLKQVVAELATLREQIGQLHNENKSLQMQLFSLRTAQGTPACGLGTSASHVPPAPGTSGRPEAFSQDDIAFIEREISCLKHQLSHTRHKLQYAEQHTQHHQPPPPAPPDDDDDDHFTMWLSADPTFLAQQQQQQQQPKQQAKLQQQHLGPQPVRGTLGLQREATRTAPQRPAHLQTPTAAGANVLRVRGSSGGGAGAAAPPRNVARGTQPTKDARRASSATTPTPAAWLLKENRPAAAAGLLAARAKAPQGGSRTTGVLAQGGRRSIVD